MCDSASTLSAEQAEAILREQVCGRVRELRLLLRPDGIVLQGIAASYYGKQMAHYLAHKLLRRPILANEIEVRGISSPSDEADSAC